MREKYVTLQVTSVRLIEIIIKIGNLGSLSCFIGETEEEYEIIVVFFFEKHVFYLLVY